MADNSAPRVGVVCGPTAGGKTAVALHLARSQAITVISADSRQVYRQFDVGTAKPTAEERERVPHLGIDVLDPRERSSAAWWATSADAWLRESLAAGRTPLVVGGTGLYLRALFGVLFDEPPMDDARRLALQQELRELGIEELRRWVSVLDPGRAHLGRTQLLRAVEIALLTGRRVSRLHEELARSPRWRARYLIVDPGPALAERILTRTRAMFGNGWLGEVERLEAIVPEDAPAWNASGYRTIRAMHRGEVSLAEAQERIVVETRQYAKRQRTWFRHQLEGEDVTRLDTGVAGWEKAADEWLAGEVVA